MPLNVPTPQEIYDAAVLASEGKNSSPLWPRLIGTFVLNTTTEVEAFLFGKNTTSSSSGSSLPLFTFSDPEDAVKSLLSAFSECLAACTEGVNLQEPNPAGPATYGCAMLATLASRFARNTLPLVMMVLRNMCERGESGATSVLESVNSFLQENVVFLLKLAASIGCNRAWFAMQRQCVAAAVYTTLVCSDHPWNQLVAFLTETNEDVASSCEVQILSFSEFFCAINNMKFNLDALQRSFLRLDIRKNADQVLQILDGIVCGGNNIGHNNSTQFRTDASAVISMLEYFASFLSYMLVDDIQSTCPNYLGTMCRSRTFNQVLEIAAGRNTNNGNDPRIAYDATNVVCLVLEQLTSLEDGGLQLCDLALNFVHQTAPNEASFRVYGALCASPCALDLLLALSDTDNDPDLLSTAERFFTTLQQIVQAISTIDHHNDPSAGDTVCEIFKVFLLLCRCLSPDTEPAMESDDDEDDFQEFLESIRENNFRSAKAALRVAPLLLEGIDQMATCFFNNVDAILQTDEVSEFLQFALQKRTPMWFQMYLLKFSPTTIDPSTVALHTPTSAVPLSRNGSSMMFGGQRDGTDVFDDQENVVGGNGNGGRQGSSSNIAATSGGFKYYHLHEEYQLDFDTSIAMLHCVFAEIGTLLFRLVEITEDNELREAIRLSQEKMGDNLVSGVFDSDPVSIRGAVAWIVADSLCLTPFMKNVLPNFLSEILSLLLSIERQSSPTTSWQQQNPLHLELVSRCLALFSRGILLQCVFGDGTVTDTPSPSQSNANGGADPDMLSALLLVGMQDSSPTLHQIVSASTALLTCFEAYLSALTISEKTAWLVEYLEKFRAVRTALEDDALERCKNSSSPDLFFTSLIERVRAYGGIFLSLVSGTIDDVLETVQQVLLETVESAANGVASSFFDSEGFSCGLTPLKIVTAACCIGWFETLSIVCYQAPSATTSRQNFLQSIASSANGGTILRAYLTSCAFAAGLANGDMVQSHQQLQVLRSVGVNGAKIFQLYTDEGLNLAQHDLKKFTARGGGGAGNTHPYITLSQESSPSHFQHGASGNDEFSLWWIDSSVLSSFTDHWKATTLVPTQLTNTILISSVDSLLRCCGRNPQAYLSDSLPQVQELFSIFLQCLGSCGGNGGMQVTCSDVVELLNGGFFESLEAINCGAPNMIGVRTEQDFFGDDYSSTSSGYSRALFVEGNGTGTQLGCFLLELVETVVDEKNAPFCVDGVSLSLVSAALNVVSNGITDHFLVEGQELDGRHDEARQRLGNILASAAFTLGCASLGDASLDNDAHGSRTGDVLSAGGQNEHHNSNSQVHQAANSIGAFLIALRDKLRARLEQESLGSCYHNEPAIITREFFAAMVDAAVTSLLEGRAASSSGGPQQLEEDMLRQKGAAGRERLMDVGDRLDAKGALLALLK